MAARETGSGTNWSWSNSERKYLLDHAGDSGKDLVAGFRKRFPKFTGSDTSIKGRRYTILNRSGSPEQRVAALEAKLIGAQERVETIEAELAEARDAVEDEAPNLNDMTKAQLLERAAAQGVEVTKGMTKTALISQLVAA